MILFLLLFSNVFASDNENEASPSPHTRGVSFYRSALDQQRQALTADQMRELQFKRSNQIAQNAIDPLVEELARARESRERYSSSVEEKKESLQQELAALKQTHETVKVQIGALQQEMAEKIECLEEEKERECAFLREKFEEEKLKLKDENQEELQALTQKMERELAAVEQQKLEKEQEVLSLTGEVSRFAAAAYAMHAQGHALFDEVKKLYLENEGFREIMGAEPAEETYLDVLSNVASFVSLTSKEINEKFPKLRELAKPGLTSLFPKK